MEVFESVEAHVRKGSCTVRVAIHLDTDYALAVYQCGNASRSLSGAEAAREAYTLSPRRYYELRMMRILNRGLLNLCLICATEMTRDGFRNVILVAFLPQMPRFVVVKSFPA